MPEFGRLVGIALVAAIVISGATAVLVARASRQEGRPLTAFDPPADKPTRHVDLTTANENLGLTASSEIELGARGVTRHKLGYLDVPTGAIVAADPAVQPERPAFARTVTPGRYALTLYKAQSRVAMAELRFADGTPTRWQLAVVAGQDAGTLKDDEIFGYPVDAGLGCFMDVKGRDAFLKRDAREQARLGSKYVSSYDDIIAGPLDANGGNEVMLQPLPDEPANVAIFQSGWGDGFYASYWGLDDAGTPLLLVTDFGVIDKGDRRPAHEIAQAAITAAMTSEQQRDSKDGYAALKADDFGAMSALLRQGRIAPETHIEETGDTFTFEAIRLDKPEALALLVAHDAPITMPEHLRTSKIATYPDYARALNKPRSAELSKIIADWESARSALDPSKR